MNAKGIYAALGAGAALVAGVLLAPTSPESSDSPINMLVPGTPSWGLSMVTATATTTWVRYDTGDAQPACFPSGTVLVGYAATETAILFSQSLAASLGDPSTYDECQVTDYYDTAPGNCAVVPAGPFAFEVDQRITSRGQGAFAGICDAPVGANYRFGGTTTYPKCEVDGHCAAAGSGGSCVAVADWTSTERNRSLGACSYVGFRAIASAGRFHLRIEQ